MTKRILFIGEKYGALTVLREVEPHITPSGHKTRKWLCACECGNEKEVLQNALRSGATKSCGCARYQTRKSKNEVTKQLRVGCDREDDRYNVWSMMIQRCYEENHDSYPNYGGEGKVVCERWLEKFGVGFLNFCQDMGPRPSGSKLDRVDNDLSYFAENCRWADDPLSVYNRGVSKNNTSGCKGVTWSDVAGKWQAQLGLDYENINLGYYSDWFEAVCARKSGELIYYKDLYEKHRNT